MRTINRSIQSHQPGRRSKLIVVLVSLIILLSAYAPSLAVNPAYSAQASPLLLTPTPTPTLPAEVQNETPISTSDSADPSADLQTLTAEIQQLTTIIEKLQAEIQNLQAEIQNLKSQISNPNPQPPNPTLAILEELGGQLCPDSDFTCVTMTMPLDHFDSANRETIDVVFGVLPATGERKGMFVFAEGGPGASGLASVDSYAASFDPSILEHFDIVAFDQRGLAASGGLQCPEAAADFYLAEIETETPEGEAATIVAAQTFTDACLSELSSTDLLPYLGTRQAVEDLELFRQAIGDEKFSLYGVSYGSQFAQIYAIAHPDYLAGLILDGVVDLTLSGLDYWSKVAQAFNDVLVATLEACNADEDCAADMGGEAVAIYDDLATELAKGPHTFTFPLPSGKTAKRQFTLTDLETVASGNLFNEGDRMLFQRALAATANDDLVPLARLLYINLGLDPETLEAIPDPTYSDAVYYAVDCIDYAYAGNSPTERAEAYIRAGDAVDAAVPRLNSIFYGELPCALWPTETDPRPEPLVAEDIPTLVLGATADPITPLSNGEQVYSRLADGYLITTEGGPHVTFGWGNACPDDIVTAFLVEDKVPEERETRCEGVVADAYIPLPPADASAFANPLEALLSADTEINYLPEYYNWDVETPTSVGCPHGGTLAFEPGDEGDEFTLTDCAFSAGFAMTGSGLYSYDVGSFSLDVSVVGPKDVTGDLVYERNENGAIHVTGEYAGEEIDLSEE